MNQQPTVFVVDDDPAVRDSLAALIGAMRLSVVCCASAVEFLATYDTQPGCLVLDVRMPGMTGMELQQKLLDDGVRLPVILITGHGTVPMSVTAMKRGAVDFLEKPYRPQQLRDSIRQAIVLDTNRRREDAHHAALRERMAQLSAEERAVMDGIVSGKTNKKIAAAMDVSLRTVQFRRSSLMKKLRVDSRAALVRLVLASDGSRTVQTD